MARLLVEGTDKSQSNNMPLARNDVLFIQWRVLKALMLRDIRTRFFGNGLGYLVAIAWPLSHMAILIGIYVILGRAAPLGDSVIVFLAAAVVPAIGFQYMSRFIMMSMIMNAPLLNFPVVKMTDIILARAILESACICCVAMLMMSLLYIFGLSSGPADPEAATVALLSTIVLGFGIGAANAVVVYKLPAWVTVYVLINITLYITAGVFMLPNDVPEIVRDILWWNPVIHVVEWMREAYYPSYKSILLNKFYSAGVGLVFLFIAFFAERFFRKALQR